MLNFLKRFREPSSWAAIAAIAALVSPGIAEAVPVIGDAAITIGGVVAGLVAFFTREGDDDGFA